MWTLTLKTIHLGNLVVFIQWTVWNVDIHRENLSKTLRDKTCEEKNQISRENEIKRTWKL